MLWSLVKNTQWAPMLDLLSPAFFDVVPARMLFGELRGLTTRYLSESTYRDACDQRSRALEHASLPIDLVAAIEKEADPVLDASRGEAVLALYFHQVLGDGPALLDLRRAAFARSDADQRWRWKPEPAIAVWGADFRRACRDLYEGFYLEDVARFSEGARALGLGEAEAEIRAQFGDTRVVTFSLADFQKKFHEVFQRCKQTRSKLHPGFLTLGLGLATLYEHLEQIAGPLDVRAVFERTRCPKT
jgi:hypothetical protein